MLLEEDYRYVRRDQVLVDGGLDLVPGRALSSILFGGSPVNHGFQKVVLAVCCIQKISENLCAS